MIASLKAIGGQITTYHQPEHPMQLRVKRVFEEPCGDDVEPLKWGIDGCNLPAPAAPLSTLAGVYASFAGAADTVETGAAVTSRIRDSARIFQAMSSYPKNVGGEGRFCTELMQAFRGALIGKVGADGCYTIWMKAFEHTLRLGAVGPLGIALKI